jgi:F-type H+-transporting ATPase subunit a
MNYGFDKSHAFMNKRDRFFGLVLIAILCINLSVTGSEKHGNNESHQQEEQEEFSPKEFIFGTIYDSYEWHILHYNHTHVTIPLPIIVKSDHTGWHVFMSSKFHHGHKSHKGFKIAQEGPNKGDIVEVLEDGTEIKPLDLSITRISSGAILTTILMLLIFIPIAKRYKKNPYRSPKGMQSLLEPLILFIRDDVAIPMIGKKNYLKFMPFLLSIFFFILLNNLLALFPLLGEGAVTGNIAGTLALALFTFVGVNLSGKKHYWKEKFNPDVPVWLKLPIPLVPVIEFIGMFTKPFTLTIRLFANVSAGHIIKLGFLSLIFLFGQIQVSLGYGISILSVIFILFMMVLDLLIAILQAYIFTVLSAVYFGEAAEEPH